MDGRLQASASAPDLAELVDARLQSHRNENSQEDDIPSPNDDDAAARQRKARLDWRMPTPAQSRSPTPELHEDPDETYSLRMRSESPEVFRRDGRADRFADHDDLQRRKEREGSTFTQDSMFMSENGLDGQHTPLEDSQHSSEAENRDTQRTQNEKALPTHPSISNFSSRILPTSLWDYLQEEIRATELDGSQELKAERVTNFFAVPMAVERIIIFGLFVCLDSFLYNFTILPLRFLIAAKRLISSYFKPGKRKSLPVSAKCDLAKFGMFAIASAILHHITDASQMYHSVRGQEVIKLYVIFNVLEIADRLCCSFGQDLIDSLCSRATLGRREDGSQPRIRPAGLFTMCVVYTVVHTLVLFYSLVSLNVAINSYDTALLTLLLSNQFVEIKSAVFKKFEKENLFQMSCADIVERFQLTLMLSIIALRNLIELSGSTFSLLPTSFIPVMPSMSILQRIFSPALIVICSEIIVDWLKHAFITKFNHIRPAVYGRFIDVLCRDLVADSATYQGNETFADQSPALARRLGFAALPIGCLVVRVIFQTFEILSDTSHIDECAPPRKGLNVGPGLLSYLFIGPEGQKKLLAWIVWLSVACIFWFCLVILKLLIGINLRAYAVSRYSGMEERALEDQLNDRSRSAIGLNPAERAREGETSKLLENKHYDSPGKFAGKVGGGAANTNMETLSRFSMIKSRIY